MSTTLVGIFDDFTAANKAVAELTKAGIKQGDISIARNDGGKGYQTYGGANSKDYTTGTSIGTDIANFFDGIFGTDVNDDDHRGVYSESLRRGGTIVTVKTDDKMTDRAADILNNYGVVDVDRRHAEYRASGYKKFDAKAPLYTEDQTRSEYANYGKNEIALPVIEEQLNVGKQVVQRGGVRIHTTVSEKPVEASVNLREEHVTVDRRPVDRAVSDADFAAVKEGTFEVKTQAEVPVVSKDARVVEEVVVGKNVTERTETVTDTVKRTDVNVEETNLDRDAQAKKAKN